MTILPRRLVAVAAALAALAALAAALFLASPALAVDNGTVGIRPATESDFFHLSLYPGAATEASAVIANHTAEPATLLTYPVDANTMSNGAFGFAAQQDPRHTVGAWVQLDHSQVIVPPHSQVRLPFRLSVPAGTAPGDYAGGIVIQSPIQTGKTVTVGGQTAVQINTIQRQAVRIYLHVAGTAVRTLQVGRLSWSHRGGGIDFALPLTNTGNVSLQPSTDLTLRSELGANTKLPFGTPEIMLPGAQITVHAHLAHAPSIEFGTATATTHSAAGIRRATATIDYAPLTLVATAALLLLVLLFAAWRITRFVRRARRALAAQAGSLERPRGRHTAGTGPAQP